MLNLDFPEYDEPKPKEYYGLMDLPMAEYRSIDALSNHELQMFHKNPATYIWNKTAPRDSSKAATADFGTLVHAMILEPETVDSEFLVTDIKGRHSASFVKFQTDHSDLIVVTEDEYSQAKIMAESALCDPTYCWWVKAKGQAEASIVAHDPVSGSLLKIRPDKLVFGDVPMLGDVKTTASIDDWRNPQTWKNPLFAMGYGFTAAFYLHVASLHYQMELTDYTFLVSQKSALLGKYPVSTFVISKQQLIDLGFWDEMLNALTEFAKHKESGFYSTIEKFPVFNIYNESDGEIEVTYD